MRKVFILCALLVTLFASVCSAEPVSDYCKLDQSKWIWLSSTDYQGTFFDHTSVEKVPDKNEKKVWVCCLLRLHAKLKVSELAFLLRVKDKIDRRVFWKRVVVIDLREIRVDFYFVCGGYVALIRQVHRPVGRCGAFFFSACENH